MVGAMQSSPVPHLRSSLLCLVAAAALALGCVCPARPVDVADASFRTPERTLRSYQAYLASDLVDWEYRCYSSDFRRRNGISLATYTEARAQLFAEKPWLKLFAKAEIVGQWADEDGSHVIEARIAGRTLHVRLVREDSFEILAGDRLLTDGRADFDRLVRVTERPEGPLLEARIPAKPGLDLRQATTVLLERAWKIDELVDGPAPPPGPEP